MGVSLLSNTADENEIFRHLSIVYTKTSTLKYYNSTKVSVENDTFYAPDTTECSNNLDCYAIVGYCQFW
jgi:hypothetical protein